MLSPPSMSPDNFVMFAIWTLGSAMESASFPMVYSITLTTTSPSPLRSSKYGLSWLGQCLAGCPWAHLSW